MPDVGRYTPVGASDALTAGVADFLLTPALGGGVLLLGYVVVFVAAGAALVAHRDVT